MITKKGIGTVISLLICVSLIFHTAKNNNTNKVEHFNVFHNSRKIICCNTVR